MCPEVKVPPGSVAPGAAPSLTGGGGGPAGTSEVATVGSEVTWPSFVALWAELPDSAVGSFGRFCRDVGAVLKSLEEERREAARLRERAVHIEEALSERTRTMQEAQREASRLQKQVNDTQALLEQRLAENEALVREHEALAKLHLKNQQTIRTLRAALRRPEGGEA
jgi:hypothetical protein